MSHRAKAKQRLKNRRAILVRKRMAYGLYPSEEAELARIEQELEEWQTVRYEHSRSE